MLLGVLYPFWQLLIGVCLIGVSVISAHRLILRGPSRMNRAIVITGTTVVCMIALGFLLSIA